MRDQTIAERRLMLERKSDHARFAVTFRIGRPYWVKEGVEAACAVQIEGLFDNLSSIHGVDTLQAVELAAGFVNVLLQGVSDQYEILWADGYRYSFARAAQAQKTAKRPTQAKSRRRRPGAVAKAT